VGSGVGQCLAVSEGLAVVAAGAVGLGGQVVLAGLDAIADAFEVGRSVLQLDHDAEGSVAAQFVVGDGEAAARDAGEFEIQVRLEVAAGGGDDFEAGDGRDVDRFVVAVLAGWLRGGQGVAQGVRGVGTGAPAGAVDAHAEPVTGGVDAPGDRFVDRVAFGGEFGAHSR